ncbi:MAG: hypothetical protein ABW189_08545 [Rickettsiales bacterium]
MIARKDAFLYETRKIRRFIKTYPWHVGTLAKMFYLAFLLIWLCFHEANRLRNMSTSVTTAVYQDAKNNPDSFFTGFFPPRLACEAKEENIRQYAEIMKACRQAAFIHNGNIGRVFLQIILICINFGTVTSWIVYMRSFYSNVITVCLLGITNFAQYVLLMDIANSILSAHHALALNQYLTIIPGKPPLVLGGYSPEEFWTRAMVLFVLFVASHVILYRLPAIDWNDQYVNWNSSALTERLDAVTRCNEK